MINVFELLKEISYVRTGGSIEEETCADTLVSCVKAMGVEAVKEAFPVQGSSLKKHSLKVTTPFEKEIVCRPYICCGNADSLKKEIYLLRNIEDPYELSQVKDRFVIVQGYLRQWIYKDLIDNGAAGIIVSDGFWYVDNSDIDQREIREPLQSFGRLPVVQINTKDLMMIIREGVTEMEMTIEAEDVPGTSHNVIARIPGKRKETVVFTAHYDSTSLSKGSWDNGSGTVALVRFIEYFKDHQPEYSLAFIFTGSEERGLLGSKAFIKDHEEEMKDIVLDINVDMIGGIIAGMKAYVTAEKSFVDYAAYFARSHGQSLEVRRDVGSTDSAPFADNGVPAIAFTSWSPALPFHCRYDNMEVMDENELNKEIDFILEMSKDLVNSVMMPVKREMPDDLKEKLDIYFGRKRQ